MLKVGFPDTDAWPGVEMLRLCDGRGMVRLGVTLALIGVMNARRYARFRKYALILGMIAAAIITPTPDPFNMAMVAIPTYALYEVGILLSRTVRKPLREAEESLVE